MGLLKTAAKVAVASSVHGRVQRRQQQRWAAQDQRQALGTQAPLPQIPAQDQPAPVAQAVAAPPTAAPPTAAPPTAAPPTAAPSLSTADKIGQLRSLGELRDSGVLTDAEFEAEKAKLLRA
jgi:hypothetical protein